MRSESSYICRHYSIFEITMSLVAKRIYLKDLHRMMDGMGMELAEKVHLLFMANYIDYSNYGFRDEEQEMNINLQVLNKETDFFGDMECESRWEDMLCDDKEQYHEYSDLTQCPMWGLFIEKTSDH